MPPSKPKPTKNKTFPMVVAALLIAGMGAGAYVFKDRLFIPEQKIAKKPVQPWYKEHARKAPEMIRLPDTPLILAAKDVEIDLTIKELTPRVPLKPKKPPAVQTERSPIARVNPPKLKPILLPTPTAYEESLPQDVYTPVIVPPVVLEKEITPAVIVETQPIIVTSQPRWMKYALKVEKPPVGKPMIALVIDDLGLDRKRTARTLQLPAPLTMAFIPYARDLSKQTQTARNNGHELLLHLPMEPLNANVDAGPNHLNTRLGPEDLRDRIHWNLERFSGYVGVNNHMGSRASADVNVMTALMKELQSREMLFLDSRTNPKSIGAKIARQEGVPFAERNVFLDNVNEKAAVLKQLSLLERVSRKSGFAVGIGHPRDGTLAALKEWLPLIENKGFTLVPISQIIIKKQNIS